MNKTIKNITIAIGIFIVLLFSTVIVVQYYELKQPGMIVLLYHRISPDLKNTDKYVLSLPMFIRQMDFLEKDGYQTILPSEIISYNSGLVRKKTIILSFDDGTSDHFNIVYPLLKKNKQKGLFFIVSKFLNRTGILSSEQIKEMSENGMEIGSHSYSHPLLDTLEYSALYDELNRSKSELETVLGKDVYSFAPPGGWFNESVLKAAKSVGYRFFFSCEIGTNDIYKNPYVYKRIEVSGDMSFEEFKNLLDPPRILSYKILQSLKFSLHDIIGPKNYQKLSILAQEF